MLEKNLVIVRHASAEDISKANDDKQRELTGRGRKEAKVLSKTASRLGIPMPQLVFSSGYARAEQTLATFDFGKKVEVVRNDTFAPEASVAKTIRAISGAFVDLKEHTGSLTIWAFGHNPHLEGILEALSPKTMLAIGQLPKASLVWLQWDKAQTLGKEEPLLLAYLPRPSQDDAES